MENQSDKAFVYKPYLDIITNTMGSTHLEEDTVVYYRQIGVK